MNKKQFANIIMALKSNYRTFGADEPEQLDFWFKMLKDVDYNVLQMAVMKLISESPFPPTISEIRKKVSEITQEEILEATDAWGELKKAIRYYGSYREEEALESLSMATKRVVKSMNYKQLCLSDNEMADRAHFIKLYNGLIDRLKKESQLPPDLKKQIDNVKKKEIQGNVAKLLEGKNINEEG